MHPRLSDHRHRSSNQKPAQIPITLFRDATEPLLAASRMLARDEPDPSSALASRLEDGWIGDGCRDRGGPKDLATASKLLPKGVVCLVSALAFHGLTDQMPRRVWIAIGQKDWAPSQKASWFRIVRFTDALLSEAVETHTIEGVPVRIFGVAKTVADCFRHRRSVRLTVALEGLQEALRQGKATPAEIARQAQRGGVGTIVRPYLEALTANA
jgi:hypothetical protein